MRKAELLHGERHVLQHELTSADRPPLAWSLPAFRPGDWQNAPQELQKILAHGFRHVVLHPTWPVSDDLHIGSGPDVAPILREARTLGLVIRLEPHLDYAQSLSGGPYRWRRDMLLDPKDEYVDLLRTLAELEPDEFTLGSELDWSLDLHADEWIAMRENFRGLRVGHKLNHDWLAGERAITYLASLDYVAISWYVPDLRPLPEGYVIGEFGLGSSDTSRPWHFDSATLQHEEALVVRRAWYIERLHWLRTVRSPGAAAFWTAGHFDVLGIHHPQWRDEGIAEAVVRYNAGLS